MKSNSVVRNRGSVWVTLLLSLLIAFPSMSTDMYLPALPQFQTVWGVSMAQANLSLVLFFAASTSMMLLYGPVSDRIGRKPVLYCGLALFIVGSLACATANGLVWLVIARTVQGVGAGSANTMSVAITKDLYEGAQRQRVLGYIGVIFSVCPMVAPTLGGWMMAVASWRWIFGVQAAAAVVALVGVFLLSEPLTKRTSGGVAALAGRYFHLLRNKEYMVLVAAFATTMLPLFAFIGGAADIYINGFGVSEQKFGIYFGVNASGMMIGSLLCARLAGVVADTRLLGFSLFGMLCAAVALAFFAARTPFALTGVMLVNSVCMGLNRPISNNMILDTVDQDYGAASAFMMFLFSVVGVGATAVISLDWPDKVAALSLMMLLGALIPIVVLALRRLLRRP
jgi:DHA1 family bicyclomycin/chloramphenicol resistance-like MFS transporter